MAGDHRRAKAYLPLVVLMAFLLPGFSQPVEAAQIGLHEPATGETDAFLKILNRELLTDPFDGGGNWDVEVLTDMDLVGGDLALEKSSGEDVTETFTQATYRNVTIGKNLVFPKTPATAGQIVAVGNSGGYIVKDGFVYAFGTNEVLAGQETTSTATLEVVVRVKDGNMATGSGYLEDVEFLTHAGSPTGGDPTFFALDAFGQVWAWGSQLGGRMGNGQASTTLVGSPERVHDGAQNTGSGFLENVTFVEGGGDGSTVAGGFAVDASGAVWAWGYDSHGQLGRGGGSAETTPVRVHDGEQNTASGFLENITKISYGTQHVLALDTQGRAWAWGNNAYGNLGDATTTQRTTPVRVHDGEQNTGSGFLEDIVDIEAGYFTSYAVDAAGNMWAWGRGDLYGLGNGATANKNTPVAVAKGEQPGGGTSLTGIGWVQASRDQSLTIAIDSGGGVYVWGTAENGQTNVFGILDQTAVTVQTPRRVMGGAQGGSFLEGISVAAIGRRIALAASPADDRVYCWGTCLSLRKGAPAGIYWAPAPVAGYELQDERLERIVAISANSAGTVYLDEDGQVFATGVRVGVNAAGYVPRRVHQSDNGGYLDDATAITAGNGASFALDSAGNVWGWGQENHMGIGVATTNERFAAERVHDGAQNTASGFLENITLVRSGAFQGGFAVDTSGRVWGWGTNVAGVLGDGTTTQRTTPVRVQDGEQNSASGFLENVTDIAVALNTAAFLMADGSVYTTGDNNQGQLGANRANTFDATTPVRVEDGEQGTGSGYLEDIVEIAAGSVNIFARTSGGAVYAWGYRAGLGDGAGTSEAFTPKRVQDGDQNSQSGFLEAAVKIVGGLEAGGAVDAQGRVWAWGTNAQSNLGDGTSTARTAPIRVQDGQQNTPSGFLENLRPGGNNFTMGTGAAQGISMALDGDGRVWSWGSDADGRLGNDWSLGSAQSTPVAVIKGEQHIFFDNPFSATIIGDTGPITSGEYIGPVLASYYEITSFGDDRIETGALTDTLEWRSGWTSTPSDFTWTTWAAGTPEKRRYYQYRYVFEKDEGDSVSTVSIDNLTVGYTAYPASGWATVQWTTPLSLTTATARLTTTQTAAPEASLTYRIKGDAGAFTSVAPGQQRAFSPAVTTITLEISMSTSWETPRVHDVTLDWTAPGESTFTGATARIKGATSETNNATVTPTQTMGVTALIIPVSNLVTNIRKVEVPGGAELTSVGSIVSVTNNTYYFDSSVGLVYAGVYAANGVQITRLVTAEYGADFELTVPRLLASGDYYFVSGTVRDAQGNPVSGVQASVEFYQEGVLKFGPVKKFVVSGNLEMAVSTNHIAPGNYNVTIGYTDTNDIKFSVSRDLTVSSGFQTVPTGGGGSVSTFSNARVYFSFFDQDTGFGLDQSFLRVLASDSGEPTSSNRVFGGSFPTATTLTVKYRVEDFWGDKVYPLGAATSQSVTVSSKEVFVDVGLDLANFKVKNTNSSVIHFQITKGAATRSTYILPQEIVDFFLLPGTYDLELDYYNSVTGAFQKTVTDEVSVGADTFYWIQGHDLADIVIEINNAESSIGNQIVNVGVNVNNVNTSIGNQITNVETSIQNLDSSIQNQVNNVLTDIQNLNSSLQTQINNVETTITNNLIYQTQYYTVPGAVNHWTFNDAGSGTAVDSAGGRHGTPAGAPSPTVGKYGFAYDLDGVDDKFTTAAYPLNPQGGFTVEAWVKGRAVAAPNSYWGIFKHGSYENHGFDFLLNNGGASSKTPALRIHDSSGATKTCQVSGGSVPMGAFHHVAGVYEAAVDQVRVYVDGVQVASATCPAAFGAYVDTSTVTQIGEEGTRYFNGTIDEPRIFNRPFSSEEVKNLFRAPSPFIQVNNLETTINNNDADIDTQLNSILTTINNNQADIGAQFNFIQSQISNTEANLTLQINTFESSVNNQFTGIETQINTVSTQITNTETNITTQLNQVSVLIQNTNSTLHSQLNSISVQIENHDTNLINQVNSIITTIQNTNASIVEQLNLIKVVVSNTESNITTQFNGVRTQIETFESNVTNQFTLTLTEIDYANSTIHNKVDGMNESHVAKMVEILDRVTEVGDGIQVNLTTTLRDVNETVITVNNRLINTTQLLEDKTLELKNRLDDLVDAVGDANFTRVQEVLEGIAALNVAFSEPHTIFVPAFNFTGLANDTLTPTSFVSASQALADPSSVVVSWGAKDNKLLLNVRLEYREGSAGAWQSLGLFASAGASAGGSKLVEDLKVGSSYQFRTIAKDAAGNVETAATDPKQPNLAEIVVGAGGASPQVVPPGSAGEAFIPGAGLAMAILGVLAAAAAARRWGA